MPDTRPDLNVVEMAAEIVSAYVRNNSVPVSELPALLQSVHDSLGKVLGGSKPEAAKEPLQPKVPVKKSITNDYLVCLEDGKRFKSLKRHLQSAYGLSPQEYRDKWGLPKDYPMVAPAYANARSELAKTMGLGRKTNVAAAGTPEPAPAEPEAGSETEPAKAEEPAPEPAKKPRRGRAKATAA
jgi:predicted transcriptional regulator